MTLEVKKNIFIELGHFLKQFNNNETVKNENVLKNDLFFNEDLFEHYKFDFDKAINTNNRVTYIINFEPNG